MKKKMQTLICLMLALVLCLSMTGCQAAFKPSKPAELTPAQQEAAAQQALKEADTVSVRATTRQTGVMVKDGQETTIMDQTITMNQLVKGQNAYMEMIMDSKSQGIPDIKVTTTTTQILNEAGYQFYVASAAGGTETRYLITASAEQMNNAEEQILEITREVEWAFQDFADVQATTNGTTVTYVCKNLQEEKLEKYNALISEVASGMGAGASFQIDMASLEYTAVITDGKYESVNLVMGYSITVAGTSVQMRMEAAYEYGYEVAEITAPADWEEHAYREFNWDDYFDMVQNVLG